MRFFNNQNGFSLISVMVSVALFGLMAAAISGLFRDMLKNSNFYQVKSESTSLHDEIRSHLGAKEACFNTFISHAMIDGAEYTINSVKDLGTPAASAADRYVVGGVYGGNTLSIEQMRFRYFDSPNPGMGEGTLFIKYRSVKQVNGPTSLRDREIQIKVVKDASNVLIECVSKAKMDDGIWRYASNMQDIYYNGGHVGIGIPAPTRPLHIVPDISGASIAVERVGTGSGPGQDWGVHVRNSTSTDSVVLGQTSSTYSPTGTIGWIGNSNAFLYYPGTNQFRIGTGVGAVPQMTFTQAGHVGIGTDNPHVGPGLLSSTKAGGQNNPQLVVDIQKAGLAANQDIQLVVGDLILNSRKSGSNSLESTAGVNGSNGNLTLNSRGGVYFLTSDSATDGTYKAALTNAGDMGIGTITPLAKLHVAGTGPSLMRIERSDTASSGPAYDFFRNSITQTGQIAAVSSGGDGSALWFYTKNNGGNLGQPKLVITDAGLVGVDTNNPQAQLDIAGSSAQLFIRNGPGGPLPAAAGPGLKLSFADPGTGPIGQIQSFNYTTSSAKDLVLQLSGGNVGIGTGTPGYRLTVNGDTNITSGSSLRFGGITVCTASGCTAASDKRLKENIRPLDDSLERILKLQGVQFDYKDKSQFTEKRQVGVIAQEVESVFPEVVNTDSKSGFKSVAYDHLVAPLIESTKSLYFRLLGVEKNQVAQSRDIASKVGVAELAEMLKERDREIAELKVRLENLEKKLNSGK